MHGLLNISLPKIQSNWLALNNSSNGKASAVIKANSYGLGMVKVAKSLIDVGCQFFYVANINEAIQLRKNIKSKKIKIAVFEGFFKGSESNYFENQLTPIINNLEQFTKLYCSQKVVIWLILLSILKNRDSLFKRLPSHSKQFSLTM